MKKLTIAFVLLSQLVAAQIKGTVEGTLTDAESNNEPMPEMDGIEACEKIRKIKF